jgi:serine/threonine-protein kinase
VATGGTPVPPANAGGTPTPPATGQAGAGPGAGSKGFGKDEPGYLTIVCNPSCDEVYDQGKNLGAAPVVHLPVSPGSHRITLRKGKDAKVITVIVVSGQVSAQRVSMK